MLNVIERKRYFSDKELYLISSVLYMENRAGINITDSLSDLISGFSNKKKKKAIEEIKNRLLEGKSLSEALKASNSMFKNEFVILIEGGEYSGNMDFALKTLKEYYEEKLKIGRKLRTSTLYPIFLFVMFNIAMIIMFGFVIYRFQDLLVSLNINLNRKTKIIFSISNFVNRNIIFSIILIFLIYSAVYVLFKALKIYKHVPLVNKVIKLKYDVFIIKIMSLLYESGVSIRQILDNILYSIEDEEYKSLILDIKINVINGSQLWKAFYVTNYFPIQIINIMQAGEKSGALGESLKFIDEMLKEKLMKTTENVVTFIQPIMIVLFATMLVVFLITVVLPIFSAMGDFGI